MSSVEYEEIIRSLSLESGGLVEIYVMEASYDDWRQVLEWMEVVGLVESFTFLGEEIPFRITPDVFEEDGDSSFCMKVTIGRQVWTTGFYSSMQIDFQGDPRDIRSVDDLVQVENFMRDLNRITRKKTVLVSETLDPVHANPYFSVDPDPGAVEN